MTHPIPAEAITAATQALNALEAVAGKQELTPDAIVRLVLEAAQPHLAYAAGKASAHGTEALGALVRETWIEWAGEQPYSKPSWLTPWADLDEKQREVDMRIGATVAAAVRAVSAARIAELTALADEILGSYSKAEGGYRGRVGQMQIAKWRERLDGTP
jgi:hypothetical protein